MNGLTLRALAVCAAFDVAGVAVAEPVEGRAVAVEMCASCHAVLPGEGVDPDPDPLPFEERVALPFEDIARTPGVTGTMLYAWMTGLHPTMPNIILDDQELSDVVDYILSLSGDRQLRL